MIRKILVYPEDKEILTSKSKEVIEINNEVNDLIQDLTDTLNNTETGCGISAVQIGVLKRVCIIKPDSKTCFAMINPKITKKEVDAEIEKLLFTKTFSPKTIFDLPVTNSEKFPLDLKPRLNIILLPKINL